MKSDTKAKCPRRIGALAATLSTILNACSAEPEAASGSCSLSCGDRVVGSSDYKIMPLYASTSASISCSAAGSTPIEVKFKVYSETTIFTGGGSSTGTGSTTSALANDSEVRKIPMARIGFQPTILGSFDEGKSADEFKGATNKFSGVATPSSEWCSDSCGVITYLVWPKCVAGQSNAVAATVAAEGIDAPAPYTYTITTP